MCVGTRVNGSVLFNSYQDKEPAREKSAMQKAFFKDVPQQ